MKNLLLAFTLFISLLIALISCSNNDDDQVFTDPINTTPEITEIQLEISKLKRIIVSLKTVENAINHGYTTRFNGTHSPELNYYMNEAEVDDSFNIDEPEIVLFLKNVNGEEYFAGVAYVLTAESIINNDFVMPEAFAGDEDLNWVLDKNNNIYVLYVWIGAKNSSGVFSPTLPSKKEPGNDIIIIPDS